MIKKLYNTRLLIALMLSTILLSCEEKEDYSHIVYRNYLSYEINRAGNVLNTSVEGSREGEYHAGSKQVYQAVIDEAKLVDEDESASQLEVDKAYQSLLDADAEFSNQMVPFRSDFREIIDYALVLLEITEEGEAEGNVKPGNKALLQEAVDESETLIALEELTQGMLDEGTLELNTAIYLFNGNIIGKASAAVLNPGFESPGYETEDFGEVDGWELFGKAEDWAPLASVAAREDAPEGSHVARIGSYTQGIYQQVEELINPNVDYTLEFDVSLVSNKPDWQGRKYPAVMLSRIIVFEEEAGNFNFITVLSESYDTLGIEPGGFIRLSHSITVDAVSASVGKKVAIDFVQKHGWDSENPIWAESFVALDKISLYRKY